MLVEGGWGEGEREGSTNRAFCRQVTTSAGRQSEIMGAVAALGCQLEGGCTSDMTDR